MNSGADNHFPPVVFRGGTRLLWNRLERRALVNRPEERVRLRYIDYLTLQCGWPAARIASEQQLGSDSDPSVKRADLICYDRQFNPAILIECKATSVPLGERAAEQIAHYNRRLQAPRLCITNGVEDYWFEVSGGRVNPLPDPPFDELASLEKIRSDEEYWQQRGFIGRRPLTGKGGAAGQLLASFWSNRFSWTRHYLDIDYRNDDGLLLEHYYRIAGNGPDERIAITFMAGGDHNTWMVAICNRAGENRGVLLCNLNRAAENEDENTLLHTAGESHRLDILQSVPFHFDRTPSEKLIGQLPGRLASLFRNHL